MIPVSAQFKTTALGADIQTVRSVSIALVDNVSVGGTITPTAATRDASIVGPAKAVNGGKISTRRWAASDHFATRAAGARCFTRPAGDPFISYPISTTSEAGWWGNTLSDASGVVTPGETFVISYEAPKLIRTIAWYGDALLGSPVNFALDYDPTGSAGYTNLATLSGYALNTYTYSFGADTKVMKIRITITKVTFPFTVAKLVEFEGGNVVDVSSSVISLTCLNERSPDNATLAVGNISAGELTLTLDNTDQLFSPNNLSSPYQPYLKKDKRVAVSLGFAYAGGSTELAAIGVYYTMNWDAPLGGPTVTIKAQNRLKKLRGKQYRTCPLLTSTSADKVVKQAMIDAGVATSDLVVAPSSAVIPYAFCAPSVAFAQYLQTLAAAVGGSVYFDGSDQLHFEDALFLKQNRATSMLTLTDLNGLITANDSYQEGYTKNRVVVPVNSLKLASSAQIWALQETLTIPAGATLTINVTFQSAASAVNTPSVTAGANISILSWTAYAYGGSLILQNTGLTDQQVTAISITGQALSADGTNPVVAEDTALVVGDGTLELSVNNALIQSRSAAQTLAYALLGLYRNPPSHLHAEVVGLPHLELSDRITVNSGILGINQDYWVERHNLADDGGYHSGLDLVAVTGELPTRATLWHREALVTAGNALTETIDTAQQHNHSVAQTAAAQNDTFTCAPRLLRAGLYTLSVLGVSGTDRGQIAWTLDGVQIGIQDWYAAATTRDVVQTVSSLIVTTDGYHVLKGIVWTKNASSSSYMMPLTRYWLKQVND